MAYLSPQGGIDEKKSEKRTYSSDLYYGSITAFDTVNHKVLAKALRKDFRKVLAPPAWQEREAFKPLPEANGCRIAIIDHTPGKVR